jgi:hypothetical protein
MKVKYLAVLIRAENGEGVPDHLRAPRKYFSNLIGVWVGKRASLGALRLLGNEPLAAKPWRCYTD